MARLAVLLVLLAVPANAVAAPRALTRINEETGFALAGDAALVSRPVGRSLQVLAFPLDGTAARPVFSADAPPDMYAGGRRIAASAQRAAITVAYGELRGDIEAHQAFGGPPGGPWTPLGTPGEAFPFVHQIDGDRLFTREDRGENLAVVVRDPEPHDVPFARAQDALFAVFAGDLVAHTDVRGALVVREWRTGVVRSTTKVPGSIDAIALRPDGGVAATTDAGKLYELRPGGTLRHLSSDARRPLAYAGEHLVFATSENQPRVVEPSGRIRRLGPRTETLDGFVTEGERVLWVANECLLSDVVTARPAAAPAEGPCPRSEVALDDAQPNPRLARTIPVVLRCIAGPRVCRGSVRLTAAKNPGVHVQTISRPHRYTIRAGTKQRIHVRLSARGYRILRRYVAAEDGALAGVVNRDSDGRRLPGTRAKGLLVLSATS